jgi:hypothetical protein
MLNFLRRNLSYANVAATLALLFAMTGSAIAANHYLISSTKQINPKVLKALKGADGKAGETGMAGPTGPSGAPGSRGEKGEKGDPGERGPSGGERGEKGEKGERGERGEQGETGGRGEPGEIGPRGEKGEKGVEGAIGATSAPAAHWNVSVNKTKSVELDKVGPFTITGKCTLASGEAEAQTFISSSEEGSWVDVAENSDVKVTAAQQVPIGEEAEGEKGTGEYVAGEGPFTALSADGKTSLNGIVANGAFATKEACTFTGTAVSG